MKDFFYEMIVKSTNASELFKNFAFELGVTCVEEDGERFIIRDEEDLQNLKFAFEEFKKALARSLNLDADLQIEISKIGSMSIKKASRPWRSANFTSVRAGAKVRKIPR